LKGRALDLSLYVIIDPRHTAGRDPLRIAEAALRGGATCLQLRAKQKTDRERLALGRALRDMTQHHNAALIMNDRVDLALAIGADGVHLGPDDVPPSVARHLMGPDAWIGVSTPSADAAQEAEREGASYLGVGALYEARTIKPEASAPRGPAWVRQICAAVALPVVGIGGITLANVGEVIAAGAKGVAMIRAVGEANDPEEAARRLWSAVVEAKGQQTTSKP